MRLFKLLEHKLFGIIVPSSPQWFGPLVIFLPLFPILSATCCCRMLALNELNLELLKLLGPQSCEAVMLSSRRGRDLVRRHRTLLELRNLNLTVRIVNENHQLIQRYTLTQNTETGTVTYIYEHPVDPEGPASRVRSDTQRHLQSRLNNGWVSYIATSITTGHAPDPVSASSCMYVIFLVDCRIQTSLCSS